LTLRDGCHEPVASTGVGHDEAVLTGPLAEHSPQRRNALIEVVLLDDDVRPDRFEQRALVQ
jgi:hypothetical protein